MKKLKIEQYRRAVSAGQLKDPLIFLDGLMNGDDLTEKSRLYEYVSNLEDLPNGDEWDDILRLIRAHLQFDAVKISDRLRAAERLAEYVHPKIKTEEKSTTVENTGGSFEPLSEEEITLFREKFNEYY